MKHPDENPLLKVVLADEQLANLRHASLNQGLDTVRRARRARRAMRVATLALVPLLLIAVFTLHKLTQDTTKQPSAQAQRQTSVAIAQPEESGVKIISDEELFALFPGRSLALIGKPGHQQLVVLDAPARH